MQQVRETILPLDAMIDECLLEHEAVDTNELDGVRRLLVLDIGLVLLVTSIHADDQSEE